MKYIYKYFFFFQTRQDVDRFDVYTVILVSTWLEWKDSPSAHTAVWQMLIVQLVMQIIGTRIQKVLEKNLGSEYAGYFPIIEQ